jgi:hypothetical protein
MTADDELSSPDPFERTGSDAGLNPMFGEWARDSGLIGNHTQRLARLSYFDSLRTSIMRDVASTVISK